MSVVLEGGLTENYEPTEEELYEYAKWLGMKFPDHEPFLWIAKEALKAPLPENWKACRSEKGDLYYFNCRTGQSIWDHPLDEHFRELFENEKQNPGPKSVSKGAKKNPSPNFLSTEETSKTECEYLPECTSKVKTLKSLKLKKKLPDDLRIRFKAATNSNSDSSDPCIEPQMTIKSTNNPLHSDDKVIKTLTDALPHDGSILEKKKINFVADLDRELKQFQQEKLKQHQNAKEEYERQLKVSWDRSKSRLDDIYEKKTIDLKIELDKRLSNERSSLEEEYTNKMQQQSDELARNFETESEKRRQRFIQKQQDELSRTEEKWNEEKKVLESKFMKEKMEMEKQHERDVRELSEKATTELRRISMTRVENEETIKNCVDNIRETADCFIVSYGKAYNEFEVAISKTRDKFLELRDTSLINFLEDAENSYNAALKEVADCYELDINRVKACFKAELMTIHLEHEKLLQNMKEEYDEKVSQRQFLNRQLAIDERTYQDREVPKFGNLEISKFSPLTGRKEVESAYRCPCETTVRDHITTDSVDFFKQQNSNKENQDNKKQFLRFGEAINRGSCEIQEEDRNMRLGEFQLDHVDPKEAGRLSRELEIVSTVSLVSIVSPESIKGEDLAAVLTEALRKAFTGSPFIISPSVSGDSSDKRRRDSEGVSSPSASGKEKVIIQKRTDGFPVSFKEHKILLDCERQRVAEGKVFVENQRDSLEKRREQLKLTRRQWKQDVMTAKEDGVSSFSKRGRLLNKLRLALENQAKGLEHDEVIIRDSEKWLLMKEQRLCELEEQIQELEHTKAPDTSINSVDTTTLMTDFFRPSCDRLRNVKGNLYPPFYQVSSGNKDTRSLSPIYNKQLDRIARRLDEMTSMINLQQEKKKPSFAVCRNPNRHRSSRKMSKEIEFVFDGNREF